MKKIIFLALIAGLLTACATNTPLFRPHKREVVQGNLITDQTINRLHRGMTLSQVKAIMGTPLLVNLFAHHRVNYIYTYQDGDESHQKRRITCLFFNGRLAELQ